MTTTHTRGRKTTTIAELVATANHHLAYARSAEQRRGIAQLLEDLLHAADQYHGFGYLPSELKADSSLKTVYDDTRRFYYGPNGHRAGSELRSLHEAVRWVVQDIREQLGDRDPIAPVSAVSHVRDHFDRYTIPDEAGPVGWAYRLVIEADWRAVERALNARYGYGRFYASTPS